MPNLKPEYILCAAVHYDDGKPYTHQPLNVTTGFVVAGRRHDVCLITFMILQNKDFQRDTIAPGMIKTQGFITSHNRFLNRQEAYALAVQAKQIENNSKVNTLFSEDLY